MKLVILSDNLQKKLPFLIHAVSPRPQLPLLGNILITAKDKNIVFSATDLEISIEISIPAQIEEEGVVTIPARIFTDLINSFPREKIILETKDSNLHITGGKIKSVLQIGNKEEFPLLYEEEGNVVAKVQTDSLQKMLKHVVFAASVESSRPALSGVLFVIQDKSLILAATDGFRLSLHTNREFNIQNKEANMQNYKLLIPARVIREALSFDNSEDTTISVSEKNNQILFKQDNAVLIGRVIDAQFPSYEKIIPADVSTSAVFDREDLLKAVKACSIFAKENSNVVLLSVKNESITVSSKGNSLGENTVEIEAKLTGEENEIAFNVRYLLDMLTTLNEERLVFEMTGPLNSAVFKIENDPSFLHLIMPIKV